MGKKFDGTIITEVQTVSLSTLADQAAIALTKLTLTEDFRILKSEIFASIIALDDTDAVDGLLLGIANGALSATQIAEAIAANGPLGRDDRDDEEEASRWVKVLSRLIVTPQGANSGATAVAGYFPGDNGGTMLVSKDRWTYSDPAGWQFFVFNNTGAALTTGSQARLSAKHFGVWVT